MAILASNSASLNNHFLGNLPLVTMGFLTYNHQVACDPAIFIEAIESLISQDYPNKEILISDDHSTDGTFEICQEYAARYPFIKLFRNEKNLGAMRNLEHVFSKVSGEFFLWACPDDSYAPNYLTDCVNGFKRNEKAIIVASAIKINYDNGDIRHFHYHDFLRKLPFRKIVRNVLKSVDSLDKNIHYPPVIHSSMIKFSFISKLYCRDQFYVVEESWFLNALIWGEIEYVDKVLYFRRDFSIPHSIKNPEIGQKIDEVFGFFKNTLIYMKYFLFNSSIPMSKKMKYVLLGVLVLRHRVYPRMKGHIKVGVLNFLRKMGFMRYDSL